jgi:linker histone H1 and H5 family
MSYVQVLRQNLAPKKLLRWLPFAMTNSAEEDLGWGGLATAAMGMASFIESNREAMGNSHLSQMFSAISASMCMLATYCAMEEKEENEREAFDDIFMLYLERDERIEREEDHDDLDDLLRQHWIQFGAPVHDDTDLDDMLRGYLNAMRRSRRSAKAEHSTENTSSFLPRKLDFDSVSSVSSDITMDVSTKKRPGKEPRGSRKKPKTGSGLVKPIDDKTEKQAAIAKPSAVPNTVLGKIVSAIRALAKGSVSRRAIVKYIKEVYGYDNANAVKKAFQTGTANGTLTRTGQSFRVTQDPAVKT